MTIQFATCERGTALGYLQTVYPSSKVTDTPEDAGPLLDLVEEDICRIQDPMMAGSQVAVCPGTKAGPDAWDTIVEVATEFGQKH